MLLKNLQKKESLEKTLYSNFHIKKSQVSEYLKIVCFIKTIDYRLCKLIKRNRWKKLHTLRPWLQFRNPNIGFSLHPNITVLSI